MIAINPKSRIESKYLCVWISVHCVWKFIKEPKSLFLARTKSVKTAKFSFAFTSGKQIESRESKAKAFYAKFVSRFSENSLHRFSFSFRDEIESSRECIFTFHLCRHRQHMWMWGSCCKREGNLKTNFRKLESQKHSFDSLNLSHYLWMAGWAGVCAVCKVLGSLYGFSADADSRFEKKTHISQSRMHPIVFARNFIIGTQISI